MLEQYDNALNDFSQSLKIRPNDAHTLSERGNVYHLLRQYDKASNDLNAVLEIEPMNLIALSRRNIVKRDMESTTK